MSYPGHLPPDIPSRRTDVPYPGPIPPKSRGGCVGLVIGLVIIACLFWMIVGLFVRSTPSDSLVPITSTPASATKAPSADPKIEAAKRILAAYRANPQPGDVYTITPDRLIYMVAQECAERSLSGKGLDVDRWRREGWLEAGGPPGIACGAPLPNEFAVILGR